MIKKYFKKLQFLIVPIVLSGCGAPWMVSPIENPIIEDKLGYGNKEQLGTLATTAQRRIVLVKLLGHDAGNFCAEPPPDAADNLASTLSMLIEAEVQRPEGDINAKTELSRSIATTVEKLGVRSQGVQFFRDGMYSLCQARLNHAITPSEFNSNMIMLMGLATNLIEVELKYKNSIISAPPQQVKTPEQLLETNRKIALDTLKAKGVTQAEKDTQKTAEYTAKSQRQASKKTAELNELTAENALEAEIERRELEKLKAANTLQAEKDKAELARKQTEIDKALKEKELTTATTQ